MKEKFVSITLALILLFSSIHTAIAAPSDTTPAVFIDGKKITFEVPQTVINGSTLVPMRKIFESLGALIEWEGSTRTVTAKKGDITITYVIGDTMAKKNSADIALSVPGQIVDGSTLVPLRFVSESLGATVGWEGASRTITISSAVKVITKVKRVVDGDTVKIDWNGKEESIRLIGVDTAESVHPDATRNSELGKIASDYTRKELTDASIFIEVDVEERDKYGRLLGYVYLADGTFYNAKLVAEGYAQLATFPPNVRWVELFRHLQTDARSENRGLWAKLPASPAPTVNYDPNGPDRDCGDFATHEEAQAFFIAAGGPEKDPHRLDADKDGLACEAPK
ncbi:stalk domain-containing protein [Paenibacillus roseipurpureus]|uniref:Stalk domain-containing protein n=1 Tax=Paenibacillus roseopurpureus TaxID=2918901 RepID=A0AA96LV35_9BACL|nr:stalk domain-containing protein [Paenibacillus sp. MBLB1832]WNR47051.1 stalk domain-containing protein [Paenibacillus sp. MBLB1832]